MRAKIIILRIDFKSKKICQRFFRNSWINIVFNGREAETIGLGAIELRRRNFLLPVELIF